MYFALANILSEATKNIGISIYSYILGQLTISPEFNKPYPLILSSSTEYIQNISTLWLTIYISE
jgi:hypothetical protein